MFFKILSAIAFLGTISPLNIGNDAEAGDAQAPTNNNFTYEILRAFYIDSIIIKAARSCGLAAGPTTPDVAIFYLLEVADMVGGQEYVREKLRGAITEEWLEMDQRTVVECMKMVKYYYMTADCAKNALKHQLGDRAGEYMNVLETQLASIAIELTYASIRVESTVTELQNRNIELQWRNTELRRENTELQNKNTELQNKNIELQWENTELRSQIAGG